MALFIPIPDSEIFAFDVALEKEVQFGFPLSLDNISIFEKTLIITVDGKQILLNNFFGDDGVVNVDFFMIEDGESFSAAEFIAAFISEESEELETAADSTQLGGSGISEAFVSGDSLVSGTEPIDTGDDSGNGDRGREANNSGFRRDTPFTVPDEVDDAVPGDETETTPPGLLLDYTDDAIWLGFYQALESGSAGIDPTNESVLLLFKNQTHSTYSGGAGEDTLVLTDSPNGDALLLDDDLAPPHSVQPRLSSIEVIEAGEGNDVVDLSSSSHTYGDVKIYGNGGHDHLWGNAGDDTLDGGSGRDILVGGTGQDLIIGGEGKDRIYGGQDADTIYGGSGNDTVLAGEGSDVVFLGSGNDIFNAGPGVHDEVTLGDGEDRVVINRSNVTDGWDDSLVSIIDFNTEEDELDISDLDVLEVWNGESYTALFVGEDVDSNNTWVVLHGVDNSEISQIIDQANAVTPDSPVPDPAEYLIQHFKETEAF